MTEQSEEGPNVRRLMFFNKLGQDVTVTLSRQSDGTWIARNEGGPWPQTLLVPGADKEEAAGAMIVRLEEAGYFVPEPLDDFQADKRLTGE